MNEHPAGEILALYAERDLDPNQCSEVVAHLAECSECQNTVAELQTTKRLLGSALPEPSDIDLQIVREAISERVTNLRKAHWRNWRWSAAVIAALVVLAVVVSRREPAVPRPEQTAALKPTPVLIPALVRPSLDLPLPLSFYGRRVARLRKTRNEAGLRAMTLITQGDGSPQLRLSTADPKIIILFQLNETTQNHEN